MESLFGSLVRLGVIRAYLIRALATTAGAFRTYTRSRTVCYPFRISTQIVCVLIVRYKKTRLAYVALALTLTIRVHCIIQSIFSRL